MEGYHSRVIFDRPPLWRASAHPRAADGGDSLTPSPSVTVTAGDGVVLSPFEDEVSGDADEPGKDEGDSSQQREGSSTP